MSTVRSLCTLRMGAMLLCTFVLLLVVGATYRGDGSETRARWIGSWAASQHLVKASNALAAEDLRDTTLRQIVHLSLGGTGIRLRLSNRYGATPLLVMAVHLARPVSPGSEKIVPDSDRALSFSGLPGVMIPPHADYLSDPVTLPVNALSDVAITLHIGAAPDEQTGHPGSRATIYITHGNLVSVAELRGAKNNEHWCFVAGVDVPAPFEARAVVVLGDSITDGHGATTNGNDRWTHTLAQRLQTSSTTRNIAVLNQGIGGNHLLTDGLRPNALARLEDDVGQPGVRYLIILEGINDIGLLARKGEVAPAEHEALVRRIVGAYEQMIARAHAHDIKVIGATIMPFAGSSYYSPGPASEGDRQAVNDWIRTPGHFDEVIDFDTIARDPEHPEWLLPAFHCGDHRHPSPAGYAAMAQGVPLSLLAPTAEPGPKIAITFDDLPAHGSLPPGETRMELISKIIAALREAHVPPTYGFVNGARLEHQPAEDAVLQAWLAAGNPLANHSWSHMNLNQHSLEDFEQDVVRNEPVLMNSTKDENWRWFRYPFLAVGNTPEKRAGFRNFLRKRDYKIAAVTMSFGDYLWNEPYARCRAKADPSAITTLEDSYLAAADQSIGYYRSISQTLYQRDIPYVLLLHVGAFDAEMLRRLLQLYRARGFQFVTLPEAERDDFYRSVTNLDLAAGSETLEEAMSARQLSLPSRTDFASQLDSLCR